ncbi:uncharacterized protein LOC107878056 isoform X5 [Capsicum annuum]|uniref:uncharacterized protein LOC107878056 isoform X5 n=1 Tax=Capsicum annuum TaxID=4072 RepID=UPI001FB15164|nr:uncharacterized protein LOC107878056 isoform X5 [Capsicum annuum]
MNNSVKVKCVNRMESIVYLLASLPYLKTFARAIFYFKRCDFTISVQTFLMEAKISLPNHLQSFFLLTCSNCSHFVCTKTKKLIRCFICKLERLLVRRCHFELDIMDASDTIMVTISKTLGERMFSLTIEQIYERVAVQELVILLPLLHNDQVFMVRSRIDLKW